MIHVEKSSINITRRSSSFKPPAPAIMKKPLFYLLTLALLAAFLSSNNPTRATTLHLLNHNDQLILASLLCCTMIALMGYLYKRPRRVYLLDYACYKPDDDRKCSYEACEYFVRRSRRFTVESEEFMRAIYLKSGIGDETYAPPFIFQEDYDAKLPSAIQEAEEGMFSAVDALLSKTNVAVDLIDTLVVACGMFTPSPSLSAILVRHYRLPESIKTYNLSGMGCSAGTVAVDLAARLLRGRGGGGGARYAMVVVTESVGLNWYFGEERSMLVANCIFRVGCAAALLAAGRGCGGGAKMELVHALRTHHGPDDDAYRAAFQREDVAGNPGVALTKDLVPIAARCLQSHLRRLAPHVLPLSEILRYVYRAVRGTISKEEKPLVPEFARAFEHVCVHTGGKAVIAAVGRAMRLSDEATEPARMTLHRFGNTSSSLVFYELAYFEAKNRVRAGDRVWMLGFGTGFKVCSLVWKARRDSCLDSDNPWLDCIHRYPLNPSR